MTKPFIIKRDAAGEIRVYLVDQDGNTLGWSESYKRYRSARRLVELICGMDMCTTGVVKEEDTDNKEMYYVRVSAGNRRKLMRSVSSETWDEAVETEGLIWQLQHAYNVRWNDVDAMINNYVTRKNYPSCTQ